jgi:ribosomal protein S6
LNDLGGKVIHEENLGRRKLAYQILKNDFASYILMNFQIEGAKVNDFEHDLQHCYSRQSISRRMD